MYTKVGLQGKKAWIVKNLFLAIKYTLMLDIKSLVVICCGGMVPVEFGFGTFDPGG